VTDYLVALSEPRRATPFAISASIHVNYSLEAEKMIKAEAGTFTRPSIASQMARKFRRNADYRDIVGGVINKLLHRNPPEIEVVEKGKGSRSGVYRNRKLA
jgi:hypothetical protein